VCQEIDIYAPHLEGVEFVSLYVGGGTPTVHLEGLLRILNHLRSSLAVACDICIELHPADMTTDCLEALQAAGVTMLSIGVESTSDAILERIGRSHDGRTAMDAVGRAGTAGFEAVNVDLMFALPGQTLADWEADLTRVLDAGVDQLSTYPLFSFPYTDLGRQQRTKVVRRPRARLVRAMLEQTDRYARDHGLERCAVWSWLKKPSKKFSSITRHHYLGFGPSAASMIGPCFYVNTFDVQAYADALPERRPVALALPVDRRLEMAYWLYWRVYELQIEGGEFRHVFGSRESLADRFGGLLAPLCLTGMARRTERGYAITPAGAYWIHRLQNEYSLNYINRLWGSCRRDPWPREAVL
jgi:oxygen-independent coproporphyrinogen-3 oxidase